MVFSIAMNSTYNVSESTLHLMRQEFSRATQITHKIETEGIPWLSLFEKHDFFYRYKSYIQLEIMAATEEEHRKWEGWIESRLRFLIQYLEQTENLHYAHPYPSPFQHNSLEGIYIEREREKVLSFLSSSPIGYRYR